MPDPALREKYEESYPLSSGSDKGTKLENTLKWEKITTILENVYQALKLEKDYMRKTTKLEKSISAVGIIAL